MKLLTYNLSWESMTGQKDWGICNSTDKNNKRYFMICINNIADIIDKRDNDIIALQEAANYKKLIESSNRLQQMDYHINSSGKEDMITFWNKKYKLNNFIDGEFENGRPYTILLFDEFIIINVHMGHYNKNIVYNKLEHIINVLNIYLNNKKKRVIIMGDFNFDLSKFGSKLKLKNYSFNFDNNKIKTCCSSTNENNYKINTDNILDTKSIPITHTIKYDNLLRSDHLPLFGLIR